MVGELTASSLRRQSVSARPPRWIQITTTAVEKRFGDSLEREDVPYAQQLTGLRVIMDDILPDHDDGPDRRRHFTIHRGAYLLEEEELVREDEEAPRPEVSPRKRLTQEVDPRTPGRENWTLSRSHLTPAGPSRHSECALW